MLYFRTLTCCSHSNVGFLEKFFTALTFVFIVYFYLENFMRYRIVFSSQYGYIVTYYNHILMKSQYEFVNFPQFFIKNSTNSVIKSSPQYWSKHIGWGLVKGARIGGTIFWSVFSNKGKKQMLRSKITNMRFYGDLEGNYSKISPLIAFKKDNHLSFSLDPRNPIIMLSHYYLNKMLKAQYLLNSSYYLVFLHSKTFCKNSWFMRKSFGSPVMQN